MPGKITLTYFDATGRAEISRHILAYAGHDFVDKRITNEQLMALKPKLPLGQLPVLETEDGTMLCQSMTIARYLANRCNLAGSTALAKAQADEVVDALNDMQAKLFPLFFAKDAAAKKEKEEEARKVCVPGFKALEKRLTERGGQHFAGNMLTWADLHLHGIVNLLRAFDVMSFLDGCDKVKNLESRVANLPNIKKWNESHKK